MQTIVKILIAFFFSHITISEPVKEKKEEVAKIRTTLILKSNSCATEAKLNDSHLI